MPDFDLVTIIALICLMAVVAGVMFLAGLTIAKRNTARGMGSKTSDDPIAVHNRVIADVQSGTESLKHNMKLLEMALESLTEGVIVTNSTGAVLFRNRLANETSQKAHERSLVEASVQDLLGEAVEGRRLNCELEVFGPPSRMLSLTALPITAETGDEIFGALAIIEDVTDAHRIGKTRRDFVANMSHELRTPIGAVSLLTEMLHEEQDPDVRNQLTGRLLSESARMTNTIDDLLELSRIESETEAYDEEIVVQELIEEAVARVRVAAESAQVHVGAVMPKDAVIVRGNRNQILSALSNLIDNAVKYSDAGDSVSVRTRVQNDDLCIVVQDTGQGIPARDLDRIFERFYRVDQSRDVSTGGTGIGLSIVRHVALNHGGRVTVDSVEGDGSIFTIEIPLTTEQDARSHVTVGDSDGN